MIQLKSTKQCLTVTDFSALVFCQTLILLLNKLDTEHIGYVKRFFANTKL